MSSQKNFSTFSEIIKEKSIVIPIIQRDYVWGRESKKTKRILEKFLESIKNKLEKDEILKLDFIYGIDKNSKFIPLDGQQRLTTLFLLGWYFAKKNGEDIYLNKNGKSKFRYETRSSSGEFCDALFTIDMDFKKDKLSDQIKDSKNFMPFWENDPTVKSMLVVIDKIHEKFKEFDFNDRLENLKFDFLDLESFKLDDDLYIKMNSRGKQLSDFENFKAEFIGFIKEKFSDERSFEIAKKFDTDWTDLFGNTEMIKMK